MLCYTKLYYAKKSKLIQEAKKHDSTISIEDVGESLKLQLAYTLHKPIYLSFKTRPIVAHQKDEQWQIDLFNMSKLNYGGN